MLNNIFYKSTESQTQMIRYPKHIEKAKKLDRWQMFEVYWDYYVTMLALRHKVVIKDKTKEDWKNGWGTPDIEYKGIAFYHLWKNIPIQNFNDFINDSNIEVTDNGEDWEQCGKAQRYTVNTYGIFDWYWKYAPKFKFK